MEEYNYMAESVGLCVKKNYYLKKKIGVIILKFNT